MPKVGGFTFPYTKKGKADAEKKKKSLSSMKAVMLKKKNLSKGGA